MLRNKDTGQIGHLWMGINDTFPFRYRFYLKFNFIERQRNEEKSIGLHFGVYGNYLRSRMRDPAIVAAACIYA